MNSNNNATTYKAFFGCLETDFGSVQWFVFFEFLTPLLWGAVTFSFLIFFQRLLVCHMHQKEGFKFCLDTKNNRTLPLDPACLEHLSVQSPASLPYMWLINR
jgi:hypothetical protein